MKRLLCTLLLCCGIAVAQNVPSTIAIERNGDKAIICYDYSGIRKGDAQEWRDYIRHNRKVTNSPLYILISTWNYDVFVRDYCVCSNPENYKKSVYLLRKPNNPTGDEGYNELIWHRESGCVWWNNTLIVRDAPDIYDGWTDRALNLLKEKYK